MADFGAFVGEMVGDSGIQVDLAFGEREFGDSVSCGRDFLERSHLAAYDVKTEPRCCANTQTNQQEFPPDKRGDGLVYVLGG